jgi:hypothetical protein
VIFPAAALVVARKIAYPWLWSSRAVVTPYAGAYVDYYFNSDNALVPPGPPLILLTQFVQGWSARLTSGVTVTTNGGATFLFGGEVGGLGSNQFVNWVLHGGVSVPLLAGPLPQSRLVRLDISALWRLFVLALRPSQLASGRVCNSGT